jgi:hypothetical protein
MLTTTQLLVAVAYADPEIVVIVNPAAANLIKDQVSELFLGKIKIYKPLDLPNSTPTKAEFYQKVSGHDLSPPDAPVASEPHVGGPRAASTRSVRRGD